VQALKLVTTSDEIVNAAPTFDDFWTLFPRHEARKDAAKAWTQINPADYVPILIAIVEWRKVWYAQMRDSRMIPLPATWLRGERWTDEIPPEFSRPAQIAATNLPDLPRKSGEIPAHVLAQIAKLKASR